MNTLQELLFNHCGPAQIAFQFYEKLREAGYDDEEILEVAVALEDIVN